MKPTVRLLLVGVLACCLGHGCGGGKDARPAQPGPLPSKEDLSQLPKRETHRR